MKEKIAGQLAMGWNLGRSAHFALQQRVFPLLETLVTRQLPWRPEGLPDKLKTLLLSEYELLKRDAQNIAAGIYPLEVLRPEMPWTHGLRFARILRDAISVNTRKLKRQHDRFSPEAMHQMGRAPDYYRRNFHYQTDGYMSEASADLYDHQVDILFSGTTDAMRRSILPRLKRNVPPDAHLLEIGCGTGRLTRFAALTFPAGQITAVDPSEPYLAAARSLNKDLPNVVFKKGFGEKISLSEETFDAAYSCFLFHELPQSVRRAVIKQMIKAVKPGGLILILDSLQLGDRSDLDWALKRFPVDFHEPFYADYAKDRVEKWIADFPSLSLVEASPQFLSKLVVFRKGAQT
jgi:ubiquinone/menaquinone biosynthesis C-methylase UbiE